MTSYDWQGAAPGPGPLADPEAPYGRSPSGRPYRHPPAGWVPPVVGPPVHRRPPRRQRSYVWVWVVAGCAAALAFVVVVAVTLITINRNGEELTAVAAATTVSMPPRAGGLPRSSSPSDVAQLQPFLAGMRKMGLPKPQAAAYRMTPTGPAHVTAWGSSARVANPEKMLATQLRDARINGAAVSGHAAYPPGPLGGSLRCGELGKPLTGSMCGWADHGSIVLVVVQGMTPDKAAKLVLRMRADIEHRKS